MSREDFQRRLDDIALLAADPGFSGTRWLTDLSEPVWSGSADDWIDTYQRLAAFVYSLGFIGISPSEGARPIFAEDDPSFAERRSNLGATARFFVHRTFHDALAIETDRGR